MHLHPSFSWPLPPPFFPACLYIWKSAWGDPNEYSWGIPGVFLGFLGAVHITQRCHPVTRPPCNTFLKSPFKKGFLVSLLVGSNPSICQIF